MIFTSANRHALCFAHLNAALIKIILKHLVGALAHLPLSVKLEATPENIQSIQIRNCGVALATEDLLLAEEVNLFPQKLIALDPCPHNFLDGFLVHSTNHV